LYKSDSVIVLIRQEGVWVWNNMTKYYFTSITNDRDVVLSLSFFLLWQRCLRNYWW